jgi:putative glutamine amidotransferase
VASGAIGRPLIGVTSSRGRGSVMWWFNRIALRRAGARSRRLCAGASFNLDDFDGLVIGGGDDIDAALYRGELEPAIRIDRERDALELHLLESAAARGMPVLGICRGAQMINVFLGGSLHESIYAVYSGIPRLHSPLASKLIEIVPRSILHGLLGSERERVNALHHQSINLLGAGLSIVACDEYGIVQAIERPGDPFLLGVQWHPEFMLFNRRQQRLFAAIAEAARRPAARKTSETITAGPAGGRLL